MDRKQQIEHLKKIIDKLHNLVEYHNFADEDEKAYDDICSASCDIAFLVGVLTEKDD